MCLFHTTISQMFLIINFQLDFLLIMRLIIRFIFSQYSFPYAHFKYVLLYLTNFTLWRVLIMASQNCTVLLGYCFVTLIIFVNENSLLGFGLFLQLSYINIIFTLMYCFLLLYHYRIVTATSDFSSRPGLFAIS